ncbi:MAG: energy transducer TonB [Bacteroidota bacterium]
MFPSRSPYLRLSILLGLFVPAFVGGLLLALSTGNSSGHRHQHRHNHQHRHQHNHQHNHQHAKQEVELAKVKALEARLAALNAEPAGRKVHKIVEQMPLFPGRKCGDLSKYKKRKACSDKAMLEYVYKNIKYPRNAKKKGVEGMAVISFVIEPHGVISNIKVVRDPGSGLGPAAAKVVRKMYKDNLRWEPGLHKGKPVAVEFKLPVRFKLEE